MTKINPKCITFFQSYDSEETATSRIAKLKDPKEYFILAIPTSAHSVPKGDFAPEDTKYVYVVARHDFFEGALRK